MFSFCLYICVLPAEMGSQIRHKQAGRQFAPSLTKKKATNLKRKNPTRFSLDQKKQIVDLHHKKVSNVCHFTECYSRLYAYVCVHLFSFSSWCFRAFFLWSFFDSENCCCGQCCLLSKITNLITIFAFSVSVITIYYWACAFYRFNYYLLSCPNNLLTILFFIY